MSEVLMEAHELISKARGLIEKKNEMKEQAIQIMKESDAVMEEFDKNPTEELREKLKVHVAEIAKRSVAIKILVDQLDAVMKEIDKRQDEEESFKRAMQGWLDEARKEGMI